MRADASFCDARKDASIARDHGAQIDGCQVRSCACAYAILHSAIWRLLCQLSLAAVRTSKLARNADVCVCTKAIYLCVLGVCAFVCVCVRACLHAHVNANAMTG